MQFIREADPQLGPHADLFRKHVSVSVCSRAGRAEQGWQGRAQPSLSSGALCVHGELSSRQH